MKQVYLLLRNNQETGPYTLTELEQQTLQPTDLIWIEGESSSWNHPSFIVELQTATTEGNNETMMPVAEKKETATFETTLGFQVSRQYHSSQKHGSAVIDATETDIELIVHKQAGNTVSLAQLLAVALVTTIIVALWKSDFTFIPQVNKNISYAASPVVFQVAPPANTIQASIQKEAGIAAVQKEPVTASLPVAQKKAKLKKKKTAFPVVTNATIAAAPQQSTAPAEQNALPASTNTAVAATSEIKAAPATETEAEKSDKRKTLGQALRKLFKKKKKGSDDEVALEQKGS